MELLIDLSDRTAIRSTYADREKWRQKGRVLRGAAGDTAPKDPTLLLPKRKWTTLLELGCGLEQWIEGVLKTAEANAVICACDLCEDVLRLFPKELDGTSIIHVPRPAHYCVIGEGELLPFAEKTFDGITAVFVGHHMSNAETFVRELTRTLKPDGWLLTNCLDWSFPPPDFPSLGLQLLLGEPAKFIVRNAFNETDARRALNTCFAEVLERKDVIESRFYSVEPLMKLHSRLEYFIKRVLPTGYQWDTYKSCVESIASEYILRNGSYSLSLPITYFVASCPYANAI